jgi:hypothetical protein
VLSVISHCAFPCERRLLLLYPCLVIFLDGWAFFNSELAVVILSKLMLGYPLLICFEGHAMLAAVDQIPSGAS